MKLTNQLLDWSQAFLAEESAVEREGLLARIETHLLERIKHSAESPPDFDYPMMCEVMRGPQREILNISEAFEQNLLEVTEQGAVVSASTSAELTICGPIDELRPMFESASKSVRMRFMQELESERLPASKRENLLGTLRSMASDASSAPPPPAQVPVALESDEAIATIVNFPIPHEAAAGSCSADDELCLQSGEFTLRIFPHPNREDSTIAFSAKRGQDADAVVLEVDGKKLELKTPFDEFGYAVAPASLIKRALHQGRTFQVRAQTRQPKSK